MKKRIWIPALTLLLLILGYSIGPRPIEPVYDFTWPTYPTDLSKLEKLIQKEEASLPLREDNQAEIIWCDSVPRVTPISIVYLHGFAGSYRDGYPLNVNVAKALSANIYLARWAGHGMKPEYALQNFTPEAAWESAMEALAIGSRIGEKVVLVSTSTGGTLSLFLAAHFPDKVHGMVNIGPNIEDDQFGSFLLDSPWGYELAHLVSLGEHRIIEHKSDKAYQYWDSIYPAEALINLELLVNSMMTDNTFTKVECPVLTMYYHKNFLKEDEHVEVSVYGHVYEKFSTPDFLLTLKSLDKPGTHFVGSDIKSADYKTAQKIAIEFIKNKIVDN